MTYQVVLEQPAQGSYTATVLGWTDCSAEGASRQEALTRIRDVFTARLAQVEILPLEIEPPKDEHPWLKFAGMFKDNPLFDEVLQEIEDYRRVLDADEAAV